MSQWGKTDQANNTPNWGHLLVNKSTNSTIQTTMFNNASSDAFVSGQKVGIYGVSATEVKYPFSGSTEGVTAVTITNAGTGYTTLAIGLSGGGGNTDNFSATATGKLISATVSDGGADYEIGDTLSFSNGVSVSDATINVTHLAIGNAAISVAGSGYANGDTATLVGGTGTGAILTITTGAADDIPASVVVSTPGDYTVMPTSLSNVATINTTGSGTGLKVDVNSTLLTLAVTDAGEYSTLPTLSAVAVTGGSGTGGEIDLSYGYKTVTISASGYGFTSDPTVTFGAGGSGAEATVTRGERSNEERKITHAGWVLRREGSGGRAGRITYETLVAMGSITGDASSTDDSKLPQASV